MNVEFKCDLENSPVSTCVKNVEIFSTRAVDSKVHKIEKLTRKTEALKFLRAH